MTESARLQDMSVVEISSLLSADPNDLTDRQASEVEEFIGRIGGIENVWIALEMLHELEESF